MTTTKHANLASALAAFQAEVPHIAKGNTAKVPTKSGSSYSYSYADLTDVTGVVLPLLAKHGLAFAAFPTQATEGGRFELVYHLMHENGDSLVGRYPLPANGTPQEIGSAITYARRYALCAVSGVAPGGDDDDASAAQQAAQARPAKPQVAPPAEWRKLIADATTMDELKAIHAQADAEGWLEDDVLKALSFRKAEVVPKD